MKGCVKNIEQETLANDNFRKVLYTTAHQQLVVMSLKPNEDIGEEVHQLDQFFRIEAGEGKVIMNGEEYPLSSGSALIVPQGTTHNIINTSSANALKIYTIYTPPNHKDGTVHKTKEDAEKNEEHFDGHVSE